MNPYPYPPQQPYPMQPYPQQPQQQGWGPPPPKRNVAMIVIGVVLMVIALAPLGIFLLNLYQYATVEDRWASDPDLSPEALSFGVEIVKEAALHRMIIFGPVATLFGLSGLVVGALGLRKK